MNTYGSSESGCVQSSICSDICSQQSLHSLYSKLGPCVSMWVGDTRNSVVYAIGIHKFFHRFGCKIWSAIRGYGFWHSVDCAQLIDKCGHIPCKCTFYYSWPPSVAVHIDSVADSSNCEVVYAHVLERIVWHNWFYWWQV